MNTDRGPGRPEEWERAVLRPALEREAATVELRSDALPEIRRRIAARRARWWLPTNLSGGTMFALGTGSLVAATVVAVVVGLGSCVPQSTPPPIGASGGPATPPASAPASGPPSGSPSRPAPTASASLRVFYLGTDRGQPRLYAEFHVLAVGDNSPAARTRAALTEMFDGDTAYDPDYRSGWPAGTRLRDVRIENGAAVVDLTGVSATSAGQLDPATLRQAVQQLIWTATAGGTSGTEVVRIRLDGQPVGRLWGIVDVAGDLRRGPSGQVVAAIWLIDPQEGATVGRSFQVHVAGYVFEATMRLRVKQGTRVVSDETITLNVSGPSNLGELHVPLTLPPGTYTIEGYELSAEDGSEQHHDNHVITVR